MRGNEVCLNVKKPVAGIYSIYFLDLDVSNPNSPQPHLILVGGNGAFGGSETDALGERPMPTLPDAHPASSRENLNSAELLSA